MPTQFEETQRGATDISGTPDPVRTPKSLGEQQRKEGAQNERRPQPQQKQDKGVVQQAADDVGGAAQDAGKGIDTASKWLSQQGFAPPSSPNPIDWPKEYAQDAGVVWGWARRAYKTLSGDYHDGVHGLYAGNSAYAKFGQQVADTLSMVNPFTAIPLAWSEVDPKNEGISGLFDVSDTKYAEQQKAQQQGGQAGLKAEQGREAQAQHQHLEQAAQGQPEAAANLASLAIAPEAKLPTFAAQVAMPLVQQLLSSNSPDDTESAIAWAEFGTILSFSHMPEPMKKALMDHFGDITAFESVARHVSSKLDTARKFEDPEKRARLVSDWIDEQLSRGGMPSASKVVARAKVAGEPERVTAEVSPEGAIKLLPSETKAAVKKLLNRVGVEDVDELVHKAHMEGISDPKLVKSIINHWKSLGLPYDLQRFHPAETRLGDPRIHLRDVADAKLGQKYIASINHYLDQIHRGLFANHSNPTAAVLRALAGHSRATNVTHQQWMTAMVKLLGKESLTEAVAARLMQAAEGDLDVYRSLRPEEKMVVDGWGLLRAAAREESKGTDYARNFVPNWVPRRDKDIEGMLRGRGRPSLASILSREARLHREEALQAGPEGHLVLGQRFKTVAETNKALAAARSQLIAQLTGTSSRLSAELENDPEAKAIRALAASDPVAALDRAKVLAAQKYADKDANFLKNVNSAFANQVRAVHTHQALNEFTQMLTKDGKAAAIKLRPGATRQREEFLRQGYEQIDDPRFQGHVFHPDLASDLNRYVNHIRTPETGIGKMWDLALKLEGKIVSAIMFSPMVHGLNIAGRMGMGFLMHPIQMSRYLADQKAILPHQWDDVSWALRSEAYNAGMVPHYRGRSYADNALSLMHDALGDVEDKLPSVDKPDSRMARLSSMWDQVARPHRAVNNYFWGMVNDYGVMMYHLEKKAALSAGLQDEAAMEYAARRANTWMGMVAPEDTNPQWHNLSRLVMFAPNWWRTWAELMVPMYRRAGFTADSAYTKFAATQSAKTIAAALAWQKMTGNLLNYALSGHLQNQNQPGNQDRIEATAPWLDHLPGFMGVAANDPKTGARRTIENPLARQQQAVEMAMGLQSGHPDYKPEDTWDGLAKFVASRTSPLLDSMMAGLNVDLYQSLADHQLRAVDPTEPAGQLSPANLLYGAIMMTPIGLGFSQQVGRNAASGDVNPVESALGTKVPMTLQEAVKDVGDPAGRTMFSWITGVNAPYDTAQRSRGIKPSDQNYQTAKQLSDAYHKQMTVLSAEALSGQMTPSQWRTAYIDLSRQHSAQMEAIFNNSPEYVNGGEGMAAQWESLYQQATQADGTLDQDKLSVLQAQFNEDHTPDQLQQMNAILKQNDSKFPMLALYHKTQTQFEAWQQQWATDNDVDIRQLHKDLTAYSALYGDIQGSRRFVAQHPDIRKYEADKHRQFDRTTQGALHSMFYGNSATLLRYLRAHHETASQLAAGAA